MQAQPVLHKDKNIIYTKQIIEEIIDILLLSL